MKWFRGPAGTFAANLDGLGVIFSVVDSAVLMEDFDFFPKRPGKKPPFCSSRSISVAMYVRLTSPKAKTESSYQSRCRILDKAEREPGITRIKLVQNQETGQTTIKTAG